MGKINDMHYGSNPFAFKKANELRNRMTKSELILWEELRNKRFLGLKFRRQHPIDRFIVDFYCHKYKLVVELDGSIHDVAEIAENDKNREEELRDFGLNIIRFNNIEVLESIQTVLKNIHLFIDTLSKNPPPLFHPLGSGKRKVQDDFKLYPNPANDYTTLSYNCKYTNMTYSISDIQGRTLNTVKLQTIEDINSNEVLIDLSNISPGSYQIIIKTNNLILWNGKLIITE